MQIVKYFRFILLLSVGSTAASRDRLLYFAAVDPDSVTAAVEREVEVEVEVEAETKASINCLNMTRRALIDQLLLLMLFSVESVDCARFLLPAVSVTTSRA